MSRNNQDNNQPDTRHDVTIYHADGQTEHRPNMTAQQARRIEEAFEASPAITRLDVTQHRAQR